MIPERDRPSKKEEEIEVTPEMIRVGVHVLMSFPLPDCDPEEWEKAASAVYRAMAAIK